MAVTHYIQGKDVVLSFYKGGGYMPFLCAKDMTIAVTTDEIETKTVGDGFWKKYAYKELSYTVSLNSILRFDDTNVCGWDLLDLQVNFLKAQFKMSFVDAENTARRYLSGNCLVKTSSITNTVNDVVQDTFELIGDGALGIAQSTIGCNATIGTVEISLFEPTTHLWNIDYSGLSANTVRIDYTIDGGAPLSIFPTSTSGTVQQHLPTPGVHTLAFTPYCDNGDAGTLLTKTVITSPSVPGTVQSASPTGICGGSPTALYGTFAPGNILFTNAGMSSPITSSTYIIRGVNIFNLDPATGEIGTDTGLTCGSPISSDMYQLDNSTGSICGQTPTRLYGTFAPGNVLFTDAGMTTPVTTFTLVLHGIQIFALDASTGIIGAYTGFDCGSATPTDYVLGNLPSICLSPSATYYLNTIFGIGEIIYTDGALTMALTGYSQFVLGGSGGEIFNIDPATGEILSATGVFCP